MSCTMFSGFQTVSDFTDCLQLFIQAGFFAQALDVQIHGLAAVDKFPAPDTLVNSFTVQSGIWILRK